MLPSNIAVAPPIGPVLTGSQYSHLMDTYECSTSRVTLPQGIDHECHPSFHAKGDCDETTQI